MAGRLKHLESIQETYFEHLRFAVSVAFVLVVHGLFPWVWAFQSIRYDGDARHRTSRKDTAGSLRL